VWLNKVSNFWRRVCIVGCVCGGSGTVEGEGMICSWNKEESALVWTLRLTCGYDESFGLKGAADVRVIGWPK